MVADAFQTNGSHDPEHPRLACRDGALARAQIPDRGLDASNWAESRQLRGANLGRLGFP